MWVSSVACTCVISVQKEAQNWRNLTDNVIHWSSCSGSILWHPCYQAMLTFVYVLCIAFVVYVHPHDEVVHNMPLYCLLQRRVFSHIWVLFIAGCTIWNNWAHASCETFCSEVKVMPTKLKLLSAFGFFFWFCTGMNVLVLCILYRCTTHYHFIFKTKVIRYF